MSRHIICDIPPIFYSLTVIAVLLIACTPKKKTELGEERKSAHDLVIPDSTAANIWVEDVDDSQKNNGWINDEEDVTLSNTWAEDAFSNDKGSAASSTWVSQAGDTIYKKTDIPAEFIGGQEAVTRYIGEHIRFPEDVERGSVFIAFIIDKNGEISEPKVMKGVKKSMDDEALRLISEMPAWDPAMLNGAPVSVVSGLPVVFEP